jgi:hypothetical protein
MRWAKLDLTYIYFEEFLNQFNVPYICTYLYLQHDKSYEPRELMSYIMDHDHSLDWNNIFKFVYCSMILFLIYL